MRQADLRHAHAARLVDHPTHRRLAVALALEARVDHQAPDVELVGALRGVGVAARVPQQQEADRLAACIQAERPARRANRCLGERLGHRRDESFLCLGRLELDEFIDVGVGDRAHFKNVRSG
jgi:hypothetical protein